MNNRIVQANVPHFFRKRFFGYKGKFQRCWKSYCVFDNGQGESSDGCHTRLIERQNLDYSQC